MFKIKRRLTVTLFFACSLIAVLTACVPSSEESLARTTVAPVAPVAIQVQRPELPILYHPLDVPYTVRRSEQPTGLPDLIMLNNSVAINSMTTVPAEESIEVNGLLVDAGIFGGKFLLRLTAYLGVDNPQDSFAMHQYDALSLYVDGQTIQLSRDTNDIGISQQSDGTFIEFGYYTAFPNLYLILGKAKHVSLELIGGKDGIDRLLVATFTDENRQRFLDFHTVFDETYR